MNLITKIDLISKLNPWNKFLISFLFFSVIAMLTGCTTKKEIVYVDKVVTINIDKNLFTSCEKPKKIEDVIGNTIDEATDVEISTALTSEHTAHIACYKAMVNVYKTLNNAQNQLLKDVKTITSEKKDVKKD